MTNIREADLREAAQIYAVSNTPLYLIRKLRQDPTVTEIARRFSGEEILAELRQSLEKAPVDMIDYVRPYVYFVALSMKETNEHLRVALALENTEAWDWLDYVGRVLASTYVPTSRQQLQAQGQVFTTYSAPTDVASQLIKISA